MSDSKHTPYWGARPGRGDLWQVSVWAPEAAALTLHLEEERLPMARTEAGWHMAEVTARAGARYAFDRDGQVLPDPAARAQAGEVAGASLLVDPRAFPREAWPGRPWREAVILELHVGTFTEEGTLAAAARRLAGLAELGITAVELMPLAQFAGDRGWGYDGVLPYALHPAYGRPQDLAAFIAEAHRHGIMVLIDAVYNHFGPEGNVLSQLCPSFFDESRHTPWGAAIAIDRPEVRAFFLQNAEMWLRDYGADGLRLDAVHQIGAPGETEFLTDLAAHVAGLELGREVHLVTEDERNLVSYVDADSVLRAQWNDDYHHAVHCLLTGEAQSYYAPFAADPFGDLVQALGEGQVDQGQARPAGAEPRGEPSAHLSPLHFVNANQTHDQIGNRALGERLIALSDAETMRVLHALLLLSPYIPMLFMGEEEGAQAPFRFFTDFHGDLAEAVRKGRRSEFPEFADHKEDIPDPNAFATFAASRPYASPAPDAAEWRGLTRELLDLRRRHVLPLLASGWRGSRAERTGAGALRARWDFAGGPLEITFGINDVPPALSDGVAPIFDIAAGKAGLRAGTGETA
ncbi:malto-oligosyltrehalose trehalohydrolase [Roseivivax sp. CAU 1761]